MAETARLIDLSSRQMLVKGGDFVLEASPEPKQLLIEAVYPPLTDADKKVLLGVLNDRAEKAGEDPAVSLLQVDYFERFLRNDQEVIQKLSDGYDKDLGLSSLNPDGLTFLADLIIGVDKFARFSGRGRSGKAENVIDFIQSLPDDQREAYMSSMAAGGDQKMARFNYRSPKSGSRDIKEGIDEWREKCWEQTAVWLPPDSMAKEFIQDKVEPLMGGPGSVVDPKSGLVKMELLVRPPQMREAGKGVYEELPSSEKNLVKLHEGARRVVERQMVYNFAQKLGFATAGDLAYAQLNPAALPEENLDAATFALNAHKASQTLEAYDKAVYGSTEKIAERLGEVTPSAVEFASILQGMRFGQAIELRDGTRVSTEIAVSRALDILLGNEGGPVVARQNTALYFDRNFPSRLFSVDNRGQQGGRADLSQATEGEPLYYLEGDPSTLLSLDAVHPEDRNKLRMVFDPDTDPLREVVVPAQQLFTQGPMMRAELGGSCWYSAVERDLKKIGVEPKDIVSFPDLVFDNGQTLDVSTKKVRQAVEMKVLQNDRAGDTEFWNTEAGKEMIQTATLTVYGDIQKNAVRLLQPLGYSRMLDVTLTADVRSELDIKMDLWTYWEKYRLNPALMRRLGQSYINPFVSWKKKQLDYRLTAAEKRDTGMIAEWRNQLNPDQGGKIIGFDVYDDDGISFTNKINALRNEASNSPNPNVVAEQIRALEGKEKILRGKMKLFMEEMCYHRLDWRSSVSSRSIMANEIVELAKTGDRAAVMEAAAKSRVAYFDYDANWDMSNGDNSDKKETRIGYTVMAPESLPRSRSEMLVIGNELCDQDRTFLSHFGFKDTLKSIGFKDLDWSENEYKGWNGLMHFMSTSSTLHLLVGDVDKIFKYTSKYPEVAVAFGGALNKLIPSLNNAISPLIEAYLGGVPDKFENLQADQLSEAIGKVLVNIAFIGQRKQSEAGKYIHEVIDGLLALPGMAPYVDQESAPMNLLDIITIVDMFSAEAIQGAIYKLDKKVNSLGAAGDAFEKLTIDPRDPHYSLAREGLRAALFTDEHSIDESKKVPIVWGTQPTFSVEGDTSIVNGKHVWKKAGSRDWEVLGLYGHKGKEILMTYVLLEYAMDKMLLTKEDVKAGMRRVGMRVDLFDMVAVHYDRFKKEVMAQETEAEPIDTNP